MTQDWAPWKDAPRGFNIDDGLSGAMAAPGAPSNGAGDSSAAIETPPWADAG
jgi:hypothetical protein